MAILYVDKTHVAASDGYSRAQAMSESTPWKTIRNSADLAEAGDEVRVKGNGVTYTEIAPSGSQYNVPSLRPLNSGTVGNPIRFRPYPGHSVTISSNSRAAIIGTSGGKNYIIWEGFNVVQNVVGSDGACYGGAITNTIGSEIGYCTISTNAAAVHSQGQIHAGIVVNLAQSSRIHHCNIFGWE
jgi:hypothetical protein